MRTTTVLNIINAEIGKDKKQIAKIKRNNKLTAYLLSLSALSIIFIAIL